MGDIKIVGMSRLHKKLEYCGANREAVKAVVLKNGNQMNEQMKENMEKAYIHTYPHDVPSKNKKKGDPYSTGDTAGSVNTVITDGGMTAEIGPTTEYSQYVEYGTRFMKAEPTIRPAFDRQVPIFKRDMEKLVR